MAVPFDPELARFFASGVSIQVGTRDASLCPEDIRGMGCRVEGEAELTVFLPDAVAEQTLANLRDNGRIAVCFTRPADHRTIQVKGRALAVVPAAPGDRADIDRYRGGLVQELGAVGIPSRLILRLSHWPCHAVRMRVEQVFVQTPGPGAGEALPRPTGGRR